MKVREQAVLGGAHEVRIGGETENLTIAKGDMIVLRSSYAGGYEDFHRVSAPGVFDGELIFNAWGVGINFDGGQHGLQAKAFLMDQVGEYTVRLQDGSWSRTIIVKEGPVPCYNGFSISNIPTGGGTIGFGGGRMDIPDGALPALTDGSAYSIVVENTESLRDSIDTNQTDGGFRYSLTFHPEPAALEKPITVRLPINIEAHPNDPRVGLWDDVAHYFVKLASSIDTAANMVRFNLPAAQYPPVAAPQSNPQVPAVSLNKITGKMAVVASKVKNGLIEDDQHRFFVDYDPASVTQGFAEAVLNVACLTYDNLTGTHKWPKPTDGWIGGSQATIYIRDLGKPEEIQGKTTVGIFGQPWMTINSRLTTGTKLFYTGVSHETAHFFQRQLTTNLNVTGASWLDEGAADWAAFDTVGLANFSTLLLGAGSDFPTASFPQSFAGFTPEQNYAVGAFAIWLENKYPASILKMYNKLNWDPTLWYYSRSVVAEGTGKSFDSIFSDFSLDYWQQNYEPIKGVGFSSSPTAEIKSWNGVIFGGLRPSYSSIRYNVGAEASMVTPLSNRRAAIRAENLDNAIAYVYGDTGNVWSAPVGPKLLFALTKDNPRRDLGVFGMYSAYRVILINTSSSSASPSIRIVAPQISNIAPNAGKIGGGYLVTLNGLGFGSEKGKVTVGEFEQTITSWSDTSIVFQMGTLPFSAIFDVKVRTAEDVPSNTVPFDAYVNG